MNGDVIAWLDFGAGLLFGYCAAAPQVAMTAFCSYMHSIVLWHCFARKVYVNDSGIRCIAWQNNNQLMVIFSVKWNEGWCYCMVRLWCCFVVWLLCSSPISCHSISARCTALCHGIALQEKCLCNDGGIQGIAQQNSNQPLYLVHETSSHIWNHIIY